MALAWAAVIGFATLDHGEARMLEEGLLGEHGPAAAPSEPGPGVAAAPDQEPAEPGS
jgi:hypothetical protein